VLLNLIGMRTAEDDDLKQEQQQQQDNIRTTSGVGASG
jgi:hypothetical protein